MRRAHSVASGLLLAALLVWAVAHGADVAGKKLDEYRLAPPFDPNNARQAGQWLLTGSAAVMSDGVQLTSGPKQRGSVWHPQVVGFASWEVHIRFSVRGSSGEGDNGMAFWYVNSPGEEGDLFGYRDMFRGLGVIFDSKDNDRNHNNPSVAAHFYDGTRPFHHADDGIRDQLAGCVADYRNRNEPVAARITYNRGAKKLDVYMDMMNRGRYQRCLVAEKVDLPREFYFGLSASTEERDDAHIVHEVTVTDLSTGSPEESMPLAPPPPSSQPQPPPVTAGDSGATLSTADRLRAQIQNRAGAATQQPPQPPPQPPPQQQPPQQPPPPPQQPPPAAAAMPPPMTGPYPGTPPTDAAAIAAAAVAQQARHMAAAVEQTHQTTREHIVANIEGLQARLDTTIRKEIDELESEIRKLTQQLAQVQTMHLEEKVQSLVHDVRAELERSLQAFVAHLGDPLDKHGKTIEAAVSASRSQFANVEQQVRELGDKHERVAKQVSLVQNSAASTVQADAIRQKVERLAAAVDSLDTKLASGTRRVEFFALAAFLIVNLALLLYMLRTLREMNRYNKIA